MNPCSCKMDENNFIFEMPIERFLRRIIADRVFDLN